MPTDEEIEKFKRILCDFIDKNMPRANIQQIEQQKNPKLLDKFRSVIGGR